MVTNAKQINEVISEDYLSSFQLEEDNTVKEVTPTTVKKNNAYKISDVKINRYYQVYTILNSILGKSKLYVDLYDNHSDILNKYVSKDLNFFCGTTSRKDYHLLSRLIRTKTVAGEAILATMLMTPLKNVDELKYRQDVLKCIREDHIAKNQLIEALAQYGSREKYILSFYTSSDPLYNDHYDKYMRNHFYAKNDLNNKSSKRLEFKKRIKKDIYNIAYLGFLWPFTVPTITGIISGFGKAKGEYIVAIPYYGSFYIYNQSKSRTALGRFGVIGGCLLKEAVWSLSAYRGISKYKEYSYVLKSLGLRMNDLKLLISTITEIDKIISSSDALESLYGKNITCMRKLLNEANDTSTELGRLVNYLQTLPYDNWSYFFNNAGSLLASYKLFVEHKNAFVDAICELGQLDTYVSIVNLIDEHKDYNNKIIFAEYVDSASTPYINMVDMWNIYIDPQAAVCNTLEMDGKSGGLRNIILAGPNAGGKSTFLTGVTTNLLLSQVFGICCAKRCLVAPFSKIGTFLNISDDVASGKSLFMAEVDRVQSQVNLLNTLNKDEFSFCIFDEMFSGTNPKEGAAAQYSILEYIGKYENSFSIVATHYPLVMLLENNIKGGIFSNYKVAINIVDGKIEYTYKVTKGKSDQTIAINILEKEGFSSDILNRAKEILKNPDNYKSDFN